MGRATYEFGCEFGLEAGRKQYPHMKTMVFSSTIELLDHGEVEVVRGDALQRLTEVCEIQPALIYLCGGVKFAGS